ncbi:MAG: hypothetical protein JWM11_393 [Planctomycetaceae bacterium]|nr:hypothetical protein [Planctomycetaceae bacterium]
MSNNRDPGPWSGGVDHVRAGNRLVRSTAQFGVDFELMQERERFHWTCRLER